MHVRHVAGESYLVGHVASGLYFDRAAPNAHLSSPDFGNHRKAPAQNDGLFFSQAVN